MQVDWNPITKALKFSNLIDKIHSVYNALTICKTKDMDYLKVKG